MKVKKNVYKNIGQMSLRFARKIANYTNRHKVISYTNRLHTLEFICNVEFLPFSLSGNYPLTIIII